MTTLHSASQDTHLQPKRLLGRIGVATRIVTFLAAIVALFLDENLWATFFLGISLLMGFYTSFRVRHQDIERPLALFWLGLVEKTAANLVFLALFIRLLRIPEEPFPVILCIGLVTITVRNLFYLSYSILLLNRQEKLPLNSFWGKATTLCLNVTMLLYVWRADDWAGHWARIMMVVSLVMMAVTSVGYLYFYYRDEEARKPVSVASQLTLSRIVLAPLFVWVFFYDNDLVYQNNHLVFKILAALMVIYLVASDGLDGYFARKLGEVTTLGKYLDPYSDKVANMSIFLCFLASGFASVWMVALIYLRELTVETLRTLGAAEGVVIDARRSGKWKTGIQGTAVITILVLAIADTLILQFVPGLPWWSAIWAATPFTLMTIVTLVTLLSGVDYFLANKKVLQKYF